MPDPQERKPAKESAPSPALPSDANQADDAVADAKAEHAVAAILRHRARYGSAV